MFVLVCELLLLCLLGYASRKFHAVDGSFASSLSSLMIDIVIPCYVLKAMLETDDLMQLLRDGLNACLAALAVMAVLFVLGSLVKRLTGGGIGRIMRFGTMFSNALIFGMPIAETYWGTPGLICLMAFYTPIRFGYYGLSELLLSPEETSGKGHWKHALHILYSPAVLAFVIGPILLAMNVQLPEVVIRILDDVGACCKPLGMMLVGMIVGGYEVKKVVTKPILLMTAYKLLLVPALALLVMWIAGAGSMLAKMIVLYTALPSGPLLTTFCLRYDTDEKVHLNSAGLVMFSTLGAVITVPMWLTIMDKILPL